jgi:hypothetical protein
MPLEGGKDAAKQWAKVNGCADETEETGAGHGCITWKRCAKPVTFCEDASFDPSWPVSWNHTIREEYLKMTWRWFEEQR